MAAAALFSSAQSLFGGSKLAGSYAITDQGSGRSLAGLWTIQRGTHKSSGKAVSIWTFDKGNLAGAKGRAKLDKTIEVLKKEVRDMRDDGASSCMLMFSILRSLCCPA